MSLRNIVTFAFGILFLARIAVAETPIEDFESSVAVLHVTSQHWKVEAPWTRGTVMRSTYLATMVDRNLFLTTAEAVAAANLIELERFGSSLKFPVEVVYRDYEANLAAVKVIDETGVKGMRPLVLGPSELAFGSAANILHGNSDRLYDRRTTIRNVVTQPGATSPYPFPAYELELNDSATFGYAEPVIVKDRLVGITSSRQKNVVYAVPGMVIKHFLEDELNLDRYRGFPFLGIATHKLVSPDMRKYLKVSGDVGVRVSEVFASSPFFSELKLDDVLVSVDGIPLDARGNYSHKVWGKVFFSYLVAQKYTGDQIKLTVIRNGQELEITKSLFRYDRNRSRIPYYRPDIERIPHIIFGGLVLQELSRPYLMTWGDDWHLKAPDSLLYFWFYRNQPPEVPGKRWIILNRVLSDTYNQGHQELGDLVIKSVNGKVIESIKDLEEALRTPVLKNGEEFAVFEFYFGTPAVMLSYKGLKDAHLRIAKNYSIKSKDSFFSHMK